MYINPVRYTTRPIDDRIPQEIAIYDRLEELSIPYIRVDHDRADTIEFCHQVEQVLGSKICKNLFLCNRQQTDFYLLMMPGDKPFKTKFLSSQLGCSRLSFADSGHMRDYLQTTPGSVSALELLFDTDRHIKLVIVRQQISVDDQLDTDRHIKLVIDRDLLSDESISGHPGISSSTLRLKREDFLRFVESTGHTPIYIDLPAPIGE